MEGRKNTKVLAHMTIPGLFLDINNDPYDHPGAFPPWWRARRPSTSPPTHQPFSHFPPSPAAKLPTLRDSALLLGLPPLPSTMDPDYPPPLDSSKASRAPPPLAASMRGAGCRSRRGHRSRSRRRCGMRMHCDVLTMGGREANLREGGDASHARSGLQGWARGTIPSVGLTLLLKCLILRENFI